MNKLNLNIPLIVILLTDVIFTHSVKSIGVVSSDRNNRILSHTFCFFKYSFGFEKWMWYCCRVIFKHILIVFCDALNIHTSFVCENGNYLHSIFGIPWKPGFNRQLEIPFSKNKHTVLPLVDLFIDSLWLVD